MKIGFDHKKYLDEQSKFIEERVNNYDKLYLEFGGKLLFDYHAKRVLPGFDENAKVKLLEKLKEKVEVIICVYSGDIQRNKIRGDFGITYDMDVLRLIDDFRSRGLNVNSVVITRYDDHPATNIFANKLKRRNIKVYFHQATQGYPSDVETIVSDEGYGQNPYIKTEKPIVVVTAPGPGSGKLATCLSQLYHEYKRGNKAGYSKFETFPVWNLPLKHPVNIAYEAATVDLKDINMIDNFHFDAYHEIAVNYNRDIETFPVLKRIIEEISDKASVFKSPTDMGVNRVGFGITDDQVVQEAARQEIIRRYFKVALEYKKGYLEKDSLERMKLILNEVDLKPEDRRVVLPARERARNLKEDQEDPNNTLPFSAVAIELQDGKIITGKSSDLMGASAAAILNAIKYYANIDDELHLISPLVLEPIRNLKKKLNAMNQPFLSSEEILIALSMSAATNPVAQVALEKLSLLKNCEAHSTTILSNIDERIFNQLGVNVTSDSEYASDKLFY